MRRALAYAYPYRAAWAAGGEIPGVTTLPASNVMPPGMPGRVEYNPLPGHAPGTTDPAKAKALLTAAGKLRLPDQVPLRDRQVPTSVAVKNVIVRALAGRWVRPGAGRHHQCDATGSPTWRANPRAPVNVRSAWLVLRLAVAADSWFPPLFHSTDIATDGFGWQPRGLLVEGRRRPDGRDP